jgi:signal transduction histidine kinase
MIIIGLLLATALVNASMVFIVSSMSAAYKQAVRPFIYSALMVILWTVGTALLITIPSTKFYSLGALLFLIAPLWVMFYLYSFMNRFPNEDGSSRFFFNIALGLTLVETLYAAVFRDSIIWSTTIAGSAPQVHVSQLMYGLYALAFLIYTTLISAVLTKKMQINRTGLKRAQIGFIYVGATVSSILAFFTNLMLPLLGDSSYIGLGPVFTLLYAAGYTFAIRQYRLFDLRLFAARATAYVGSLLSILGIYILGARLIREQLQSYTSISLDNEIFYAVIMFIAVIFYPWVKKGFDDFTTRIFFHQDYDVQDVMDKLGDILLRARVRNDIGKNIVKLFGDYLLISTVTIVYAQENSHSRTIIEKMNLPEDIPVVDLTEVKLKDAAEEWVHQHGVAAIAPIETHSNKIGWLLLGAKKNGAPYTTKDMRAISIAADEIAIGLENILQYEQINDFNVVLKQNIKDATGELRASNRKLQRLDESKDEFISMASHQLRTPLTSIKGYISMVLDGDMGEITPQQRKVLEEAFASSQRMVYLIGDFLNVSRIQTGKFMLEKSQVQLAHIIKDEIEQLKDTAAARHIKLAYTAPEHFPILELDENKIRQVMMNFIDNAIYYSPPDTTITVSIVKRQSDITFKVEDQGIGVPKEEQHQLFTKFYRASNARKQRPDGTGIGLFMAKKVIVAHGGSIIFETREGKGSTFGFRLPVSAKLLSESAHTEATAQPVR